MLEGFDKFAGSEFGRSSEANEPEGRKPGMVFDNPPGNASKQSFAQKGGPFLAMNPRINANPTDQ
jgi:hypothetical protein